MSACGMTYFAVSPAQKGVTVWAQPVTDEEYKSAAVDSRTVPVARTAGAATLIELVKADSTFTFNMASAAFAPGKRLDWHKEPNGQILVITDGTGYQDRR